MIRDPFDCTSLPIATAPDGLPLLAAGRHDHPGDGACFMEFASVLAGEPFSDHPRCTPALLAELARRVNDAVDDATRQRLLPLVPAVVNVDGGPRCSAIVVATAAEYALRICPMSRSMHRTQAQAIYRSRAARVWLTVTEPFYVVGSGQRAILAAVNDVAPAGSAALHDMLANCIAAARHRSASVRPSPAPATPPIAGVT